MDDSEVLAGLSGSALDEMQKGRRYLSREEKIDVTILHAQRQPEAEVAAARQSLYVRAGELTGLFRELGITT